MARPDVAPISILTYRILKHSLRVVTTVASCTLRSDPAACVALDCQHFDSYLSDRSSGREVKMNEAHSQV